MKKGLKIFLGVIAAIIVAFAIFINVELKTNPRVKILASLVHFTETTLKDPAYLLYDVDIMELFHDYFNSDTHVSGDMSIYEVKDLGFSFSMEVDATRSLEQKKFISTSGVEVLGIDAGSSEIYVEDDTIYLMIPNMDLSFAFPTGMDLFKRMPDLTHDIDREWFHDNAANIVEFTGQIKIEETGQFIRETNGEKAVEYKITIPQGTGAFMWELLGMDMPEYDVVVSMYINEDNELRRMTIDLDKVMEGASIVLDGKEVGTMYFYFELPDGEKAHMTMTRLADKTNTISIESVYDTNTDVHYNMVGNLTWTNEENGFTAKIKDMEIQHGDEVLAKINFNGQVEHVDDISTAFDDIDSKILISIKKLDWKSIRDDVQGFTKDIIAQLKEVRKNK